MFILRRLLSISVVILAVPLPLIYRIIIFTCVHVSTFAFTLIVRPFQHIKDNLIEILNDVSYAAMTLILLKLNKEEDWNKTTAVIGVYFLLGSTSLTVLIQICFLIASIISCIKTKCKKNKNKSRVPIHNNNEVSKIEHNPQPSMMAINNISSYEIYGHKRRKITHASSM